MKKKTKIILIVTGVILLGLWGFSQLLRSLAPGSYPFAERYEMNVKESVLIETIKNFKRDNPQYNVPPQAQLKDGRSDEKDFWYHIYFYYPKENQIVLTWTRPSTELGKTTFALVRINNGLSLGKWKNVNDDFGFIENRRIKEDFEERIVSKIEMNLPK